MQAETATHFQLSAARLAKRINTNIVKAGTPNPNDANHNLITKHCPADNVPESYIAGSIPILSSGQTLQNVASVMAIQESNNNGTGPSKKVISGQRAHQWRRWYSRTVFLMSVR